MTVKVEEGVKSDPVLIAVESHNGSDSYHSNYHYERRVGQATIEVILTPYGKFVGNNEIHTSLSATLSVDGRSGLGSKIETHKYPPALTEEQRKEAVLEISRLALIANNL